MTFESWLQNRQIPDADRISVLIQAARKNGIPEGELRGAVDLPRKLMDDLLAALVGSGQIRAVERGGKRWYFNAHSFRF